MDEPKLFLTVAEIKAKIAEQQKRIEDYVQDANKQIAAMQGSLAVWQHLLAKAQEQEEVTNDVEN